MNIQIADKKTAMKYEKIMTVCFVTAIAILVVAQSMGFLSGL